MDGLVTHIMSSLIRASMCADLTVEEKLVSNAGVVPFVAYIIAGMTTVVSWIFGKLTESPILYLRDTIATLKLVAVFAMVYQRAARYQRHGNLLLACPLDVWDAAYDIADYMICFDCMLLAVTLALRWIGVRDARLVSSAFVIICGIMISLFKE